MTSQLEIASDTATVQALVPEWEALARRARARAFRFPTWALAWSSASGARGRPWIVTARCGGELVGVAPFEELRLGGAHVLRLLGYASGQTSRLLVAPGHDPVAEEMWTIGLERSSAHFLQVRDLEDDDRAQGLLEFGGWEVLASPSSVCPFLRITGTFDELLASRPKQLRTNLKRARRRAEREGLGFEVVHATTPEQLEALIPELAFLVRASHVGQADDGGARATLASGRLPRVVVAMAAQGRLHTVLLRVGGAPAGFEIALVGAGVVTGYQTGFDPAKRRFAPGHVCIAEQVRWAFDAGMEQVDFSLGDMAYKWLWCDDAYRTLNVQAATGRARMAVLTGVQRIRRVVGWRTPIGSTRRSTAHQPALTSAAPI